MQPPLQASTDRWGRSVADLVSRLQELQHLDVGFVSLSEALDLTTPARAARWPAYSPCSPTKQRWPRTSNLRSVVSEIKRTVGIPQPQAYPTSKYTFGFALDKSAIYRRARSSPEPRRRSLAGESWLVDCRRSHPYLWPRRHPELPPQS